MLTLLLPQIITISNYTSQDDYMLFQNFIARNAKGNGKS